MHLQVVAATTVAWLVSFAVLNAATCLLPLFDASPRLVRASLWPLMRWDSFHFAAVADDGYAYEHQWAFLPATPYLVSVVGLAWWPVALLVLACASTTTLYQLSLHHFPASPSLARLVTFVALLPTSPPTLYFAPYAEPFFTFLSFKGMLHAARQQWVFATICFTIATAFRSNGVLLGGYIIWGLVVHPFLRREKNSLPRVVYAAVLTAAVASPFVYYNYLAYQLFCTPSPSLHAPPWCFCRPSSIYTYVQSKYWNVGFLRYWSLARLPNFLVAAPPVALLLAFSLHHILWGLFPLLRNRLFPSSALQYIQPASPFLTSTITPHIIHTVILSITLLFFSHTQIILRLSAALPTIYWAAAWLLLSPPEKKSLFRCGLLWIWWSLLWSLMTLGLWAAFLPPA